MILRRVLIVLASTAIVGAGLIFGAAAVTAEGALHPPRLAIAKVCPCIAHMTCRDAQVVAPDGAIQRGWYFEPEKPNGRAIVVLHGIGDSRSGVVGLGYIFLRQGYTVLTPDLRGHGESDGFSTYGISEEQDIHAWADWLLRQPDVHAIYGFGASLGASVLLESLRRETRFHAIVAESPFTNFSGIAKERVGRVVPAWLTLPFVDSGIGWALLRYHVNLARASAIEAVRRTRTAVLLIHGLADDQTSPENSIQIAAANPAVTRLWLVPGAGHANAWATAGKEFESRVSGFLAPR